MTPGGLGANKFKNKLKNWKIENMKQKVWQLSQIKYRINNDEN